MKKDATNGLLDQYKSLVGDSAYNNKNATVATRTIDCSDKFDTVQLAIISDEHLGSCDSDVAGLVENLKYANSQENAYICFLGDGMNTAIVGSKSDAYEDILSPQQQLDIFSQIL